MFQFFDDETDKCTEDGWNVITNSYMCGLAAQTIGAVLGECRDPASCIDNLTSEANSVAYKDLPLCTDYLASKSFSTTRASL